MRHIILPFHWSERPWLILKKKHHICYIFATLLGYTDNYYGVSDVGMFDVTPVWHVAAAEDLNATQMRLTLLYYYCYYWCWF